MPKSLRKTKPKGAAKPEFKVGDWVVSKPTVKKLKFGCNYLIGEIGQVIQVLCGASDISIEFPIHSDYIAKASQFTHAQKPIKPTKPVKPPQQKVLIEPNPNQETCVNHSNSIGVAQVYWDERWICQKCLYYQVVMRSTSLEKLKTSLTSTHPTLTNFVYSLRSNIEREAAQIAKVDTNLVLAQAAADFYVLYDYSIDHLEARGHLEKLAAYLAEQFERYMLHAVTGEVRYFPWFTDHSSKAVCVPSIRKDLTKIMVDKLGKKTGIKFVTWLQEHPRRDCSREHMWEEANDMAASFGKEVFVNAIGIAFRYPRWQETDGDVGGEKWAVIAETLYQYLTGEINDIIFVDTAFGLKHNGNLHFDKVWPTYEVERVLNLNQEGRIDLIKKLISEEVKRIVR